jgi:hypothetical protein
VRKFDFLSVWVGEGGRGGASSNLYYILAIWRQLGAMGNLLLCTHNHVNPA